MRMAQDNSRHAAEVYAKFRRIRPKRRARARVEQYALVPVLDQQRQSVFDQQRQSVFGDEPLRRTVVNDIRNPCHFTLSPSL